MKKKIALIAVAAIASLSAALYVGCSTETHALVKVEAKDPTCIVAGNTEYYKCYDDGCGKIFSDAEGKHEVTLESVTINALGHTLTGIGTPSDPSCTEDGITAGEKCSTCGMLVTEQQVITKKGHHATKVNGTDATCEDDGTITYYACSDCGKNFIDDECVTEAKNIVIPATGHAYGEWTSVGTTGKHQAVCEHDSSHILTENCSYGKISDFTDGTGHYLTCNVCGGTSEKLPHTLKYHAEGDEHWAECHDCAYVSDRETHSATELKVDVVGAKLYGGRTLTKSDLTVRMLCVCGHTEDVSLDEITFDDVLLVDGDNQLTLTYSDKAYTFAYDAPTEPTYALTVVGATFANGTDTVELKEGAAIPVVTLNADKTFLGYRNGLTVISDLSAFAMPDKAATLVAIYEEDTVHFAPANKSQTQYGNELYAHVVLDDGTIATRFVWGNGSAETKKPHSGSDTGTHKVNVYSPAHGESLMFVYVVNNGNKDVELQYQNENYGVQGDITFTAKAGQTTVVPFVYGSNGGYGTFSTCDHFITLLTQLSDNETVTLDIYGKLVGTDNNKLVSFNASFPYDFNAFYEEGDTIDLSKLTVTGSISGYSVNLYDYTCNVKDGASWTPDITEIVVSHSGFSKTIKLNSYDNWIHASLPANPNDNSWLAAEHITDEATGLPSTRFTFKAGTAADSDTYTDPTPDKGEGKDYNTSMPQHSGKTRQVIIYAKNTGNAAIKVRVYWENNGDIGGTTVELAAGESGEFACTVTAAGPYPNTTGCRINIKLLEAVGDEDVTLEMYTMYKSYDGEITGISVGDGCQRTTFTVGETFSASGLRLGVTASVGSEGNCRIVNATTDLDGHVFTADDLGEKTVTVTWNGLTTTYKINVVAAE